MHSCYTQNILFSHSFGQSGFIIPTTKCIKDVKLASHDDTNQNHQAQISAHQYKKVTDQEILAFGALCASPVKPFSSSMVWNFTMQCQQRKNKQTNKQTNKQEKPQHTLIKTYMQYMLLNFQKSQSCVKPCWKMMKRGASIKIK